MSKKMVTEKTWEEFRNTGLLLFINQILHVFGWAIVFQYNDDSGIPSEVYPSRVKFRGFDNKDVSESYSKISEYLSKNAGELLKEAKE